MLFLRNIICLLLIAVTSLLVRAQDDKPIRVDTNLVNVNVSIVDRKGKYVEGLERPQFEVFDNGVKQEITHFSSEAAPISFGIVYDMHPTTDERTNAVLESLRQFTKGLRKNDDFFTLVFNKRGSLVLDFVPNAEQVRTHLSGDYTEPNALYDAIYLATNKIREKRNLKRVLFVITDSADHRSEHRFSDVLEQVKMLDAQVYTILWDEAEEWSYGDIATTRSRRTSVSDATALDRGALEELTNRTGGTLTSPIVQNAQELFRIYNQIAFEIRKQYALGFYPDRIDGKSHRLVVRLRSVRNSKKMVLRYRSEYQNKKMQ